MICSRGPIGATEGEGRDGQIGGDARELSHHRRVRARARAFLSDCYMNMQRLNVQMEPSGQPGDFVVMATRMQHISCLQATHAVCSACVPACVE